MIPVIPMGRIFFWSVVESVEILQAIRILQFECKLLVWYFRTKLFQHFFRLVSFYISARFINDMIFSFFLPFKINQCRKSSRLNLDHNHFQSIKKLSHYQIKWMMHRSTHISNKWRTENIFKMATMTNHVIFTIDMGHTC